MDILTYVKPFLLGGTVIAGAKAVSSVFPPQFAALVGGMPTGIIASFFMSGEEAKKKYFLGYAYSSAVITLAILFIHLMSEHTSMKVDVIAAIGYVLWAVVSYFVIKFTTTTNTKQKK